MCFGNQPGNSSSALMRKQAVLEAGGYDEELRPQNAQGCEDWKLYLHIAESYSFAVIREYLTYYRVVVRNMSSDVLQMMRSHDLVASEFGQAHPEYSDQLHQGRNLMLEWLTTRALSDVNLRAAAVLMIELFKNDYRFAAALWHKWLARLPSWIRSKVYQVKWVIVIRGRSKVEIAVPGAEDWDELLLPEIERQQLEGKEVAVRVDVAFAKPEI
jgi:hypothetical protein